MLACKLSLSPPERCLSLQWPSWLPAHKLPLSSLPRASLVVPPGTPTAVVVKFNSHSWRIFLFCHMAMTERGGGGGWGGGTLSTSNRPLPEDGIHGFARRASAVRGLPRGLPGLAQQSLHWLLRLVEPAFVRSLDSNLVPAVDTRFVCTARVISDCVRKV